MTPGGYDALFWYFQRGATAHVPSLSYTHGRFFFLFGRNTTFQALISRQRLEVARNVLKSLRDSNAGLSEAKLKGCLASRNLRKESQSWEGGICMSMDEVKLGSIPWNSQL